VGEPSVETPVLTVFVAQLVLGQRSSEALRMTCYVPSWDLRTLAVHAAAGTPEAVCCKMKMSGVLPSLGYWLSR
jgi:hypothetical protein